MIGNDKFNFLHNLFLTNRKNASLFKDIKSKDIKLSKTQLSKIIQVGGFLGRLLGSLMEVALPPINSALILSAESVLVLLGQTAAVSAVDGGLHKKYQDLKPLDLEQQHW